MDINDFTRTWTMDNQPMPGKKFTHSPCPDCGQPVRLGYKVLYKDKLICEECETLHEMGEFPFEYLEDEHER